MHPETSSGLGIGEGGVFGQQQDQSRAHHLAMRHLALAGQRGGLLQMVS